MPITFKPLWKLIIYLDMTKEKMRTRAGLSPATIAKLGEDGNVTSAVRAKICIALDCRLSDIAAIVPEEPAE
ncbi:transcriptional regulator [Bifidobacterium pseudolongum subsp. globosum]|uniref:Transcriptional regulator n=1 Tax=Bifidobacterium pseudolongum subsp. globosum TaxID=1690 RepID=A0A2N3QQ38_9BIFI|nr:helix-turn-helix domain-containing protein [Bifidobacterium pseudolongum]MCH4835809.1 helix-turn-helix transcriptional regulator [Bifidobacterium pseudolongum]MCH4850423.1 helix-turn-helix transcriptional regulator [Bifidobacterium pseudolongum]PKU93794.1 transcriptional regulator [Bifidobacterium pseudolongum subsp. globosum]PKU99033.1 transcriptional regulator [Bifidobacterium pseudolongum subsp. globosum]PKV03281.1 transcriptional regulator [Bifidobacterium pseudolongum subsp. globosum]